MQPMKVSREGRSLIKTMEGNVLHAYQDCVGIWTIGVGHTAAAGDPKPAPGMRISDTESDQILARDLTKFEIGVMKLLKRQPTQAQFDAMVSLAFNIGPGAFAKSSVVSRFNRGDFDGAAAAFLMWNKAGGRVVAGLDRRRRAEMKLFNTGSPDQAKAKFGIMNIDPEEMPKELDAPEPPKTMATSKTGWTVIATGVSGVGAAATAAQPILEGVQNVKDTAGQAVGLIGVDGKLAILLGFALVIVVGCAFIWWDRRNKLYHDGV